MGQRSQIYVRFNNGDKKGLIANYYQWNYGERMISRARYGIECAMESLKYNWYYTQKSNVTRLSKIFDTNFDMKDVAISCDILKEYRTDFPEEDQNDFIFKMQDNNDGKLFVDIENDCIKYAFLDYNADSKNIMNGKAYMEWDSEGWENSQYISEDGIKACKDNIKQISEMAILMTEDEVEEFINYPYQIEED